MEVLHGDNVPLNGDHTHFIMIDDGSRYRFFGKSTDFITRFETMVRDQEPMVKFHELGFCLFFVKRAKMLGDQGVNFINVMFYEQLLCAQIPKVQKRLTTWLYFLHFWDLQMQKLLCRKLMKLTLGVDFINILRAAFVRTDPESKKIQFSHQYLFTLLGSVRVKAAWWNWH